ncbi:hypothetical protein WMF45_34405 [Sorangium sp. So ce448]|uniref:hypothetical protein n=1 Tax=Sorangium sp. So ce448 TaxID=3133314 RepID=UPI003F631D53
MSWKYSVIKALRSRPYLVLLFGIGCLLAGFSAVAIASPEVLKASGIYVLAGFMALPIVAATIIEWRAVAIPEPHQPPEEPKSSLEENTSSEAGRFCKDLRRRLEEASRITHATFVNNQQRTQDEWLKTAEQWSRGSFAAYGPRYSDVLLESYRAATKSVFATSIPDYSETWDSAFGDRLLEAHKTNDHRAHVDRVFVFDTRGSINDAAIRQMKHQNDAGVRIWVYIDAEDPTFQFPPGISRDFTIIDDAIVATTRSYGRQGEGLEAVWEYRDETHLRQVRIIRDKLLAGSIKLEKFLQQYDSINEHSST